jgi:hypothetical protein
VTLTVLPVTLPAGFKPAMNGKLTACQLKPVFLPGHGMGSLFPTAARAWSALALIAHSELNVQLTATSVADTYRPYENQVAVFQQRYVNWFNPLICTTTDSRVWNGVRWYKRRNVAACATPGTSNHGYGLAIDSAVWAQTPNGNWYTQGITADPKVWAWMLANVTSFGFSWESSEPWHIRHIWGDTVSQRVKDIELWITTHGGTI